MQLSKMIPWNSMEEEFAKIFDEKQAVGPPATQARLAVGLLLFQHILICLMKM
jgi:hypothetical protein